MKHDQIQSLSHIAPIRNKLGAITRCGHYRIYLMQCLPYNANVDFKSLNVPISLECVCCMMIEKKNKKKRVSILM